jgi:hypothetical protein
MMEMSLWSGHARTCQALSKSEKRVHMDGMSIGLDNFHSVCNLSEAWDSAFWLPILGHASNCRICKDIPEDDSMKIFRCG